MSGITVLYQAKSQIAAVLGGVNDSQSQVAMVYGRAMSGITVLYQAKKSGSCCTWWSI
jgi:hypothetical protein